LRAEVVEMASGQEQGVADSTSDAGTSGEQGGVAQAAAAPASAAAQPKRQLISGTPVSPATFARLVLVLTGLVWLAIGLWAMADPVALADSVDFELRSDLARLEVRAMYGGFSIALGVIHLLATTRAAWLLPALAASGISMVGLVSGRLLSVAVDGFPGPFAMVLIGSESVGIALIGLALWRMLVAARAARRAAA
jgi:hypothetical protein